VPTYEAIKRGAVKSLVKKWFGIELTPTQTEIVRAIGYGVYKNKTNIKRLMISCMTRYGKSYCVSLGIIFFILRNPDKRIILIAPLIDQAKIIRNYIGALIIESPILSALIDIQVTGLERMKSEVSKQRLTFKNGVSLTILSAEGSAVRLMGHGGDLVLEDETGLISDEVHRVRVLRMLGDSPDSIYVGIGNPWSRDNHMYEHWIDPNFTTIHVNAALALKEGRVTQEFLDSQKPPTLRAMEYQILYDAEFPEESADSLFRYKEVLNATTLEFDYEEVMPTRIISCDVADKGNDLTVIMEGWEHDGTYKVEDIYSEAKSENTAVAGRIIDAIERALVGIKRKDEEGQDITYIPNIRVNIDTIGIGVGVVSQVREYVSNNELENVILKACHFGEGVGAPGKEEEPYKSDRVEDRHSDSARKRFANRKAEQFFRLNDLFKEEQVSIPNNRELIKELMSIGWEFTSTRRNKIIDPEKSPDYADALVYFIWNTNDDFYMEWGRPK